MIDEARYIEAIINCSKWNGRNEKERKSRYPMIEPQTGVFQRPTSHLYRNETERYPPHLPTYYCTYSRKRWKRKKNAPSSDATEMKYIVQCNPAISEVINQATAISTEASGSNEAFSSSDFCQSVDRRGRQTLELLENDLEEPSEEEVVDMSDEDDWSEPRKKRKKRGGAVASSGGRGGSRRGTTSNVTIVCQPISSDPKAFACNNCGAKYRSRPGLTYHRAHVHPDVTNSSDVSQLSNLLSSTIEISTTCDLCLGDRNENKKTNTPEELVSCHDCGRSGHPTCLKFTENMLISTRRYGWQCIECKSCAICGFSDNDDQLLFCDDCDRGFHLYCLRPPLSQAPEGEWSCYLCQREFGPKASLPTQK